MSIRLISRRDARRSAGSDQDVHTPSSIGCTPIDWRLGAVATLLASFTLGCGSSAAEPANSHGSEAANTGSGGPASREEPAGGSGALADGESSSAILPADGGVEKGARAHAGASPDTDTPMPESPPQSPASRPRATEPQPPAAGASAEGTPPLPEELDYREVIASEWEIASGDDEILCIRRTADVDLRINQFKTVQPAGTHHLGLYVSATPDKPDGMIDCNLLETGERLIVGAAPGSDAFGLPTGVAFRVDAGNQLLMQLHLLNPTDEPLRGRTTVQAVVLAEDAVKIEADVVTAQLLSLVLPRGRSQASGRCTFDRAQTLVAFGAHMHQAGRHAKVVLHRAGGGEQVLGDGAYDFTEQRRYALDRVEVGAGDYVEYECTYENTTDGTIYWGEGWSDEMCLFNFYRFPAGGETFCYL